MSQFEAEFTEPSREIRSGARTVERRDIAQMATDLGLKNHVGRLEAAIKDQEEINIRLGTVRDRLHGILATLLGDRPMCDRDGVPDEPGQLGYLAGVQRSTQSIISEIDDLVEWAGEL